MTVDSRHFPVAKQPKQKAPLLFPPGYWDRPPPRTKGDETVQPIQVAVGQAMSVWEYMEEELSYLCILLADVKENNGMTVRAVYRLFGSIESSAGRRNALEALAEIYFWPHFMDDNIRIRFRQLMTAVSDASARRDDLAHMARSSTISLNREKVALLVLFSYHLVTIPKETNHFRNCQICLIRMTIHLAQCLVTIDIPAKI
jgi:hypothetical protein